MKIQLNKSQELGYIKITQELKENLNAEINLEEVIESRRAFLKDAQEQYKHFSTMLVSSLPTITEDNSGKFIEISEELIKNLITYIDFDVSVHTDNFKFIQDTYQSNFNAQFNALAAKYKKNSIEYKNLYSKGLQQFKNQMKPMTIEFNNTKTQLLAVKNLLQKNLNKE